MLQSYRADKALAVDKLWSSLSLYLNHCATQAAAAAAILPPCGDIPADSASEVADQADHDDAAEQADDGGQAEAGSADAATPEAATVEAADQDEPVATPAASLPAEQEATQV